MPKGLEQIIVLLSSAIHLKQHAKQQGVTEQLKAENQILWVQMMNNISQQVKKIVYNDIVYII